MATIGSKPAAGTTSIPRSCSAARAATLLGGEGSDTLLGGDGRDRLRSDGVDVLGGGSTDFLYGGGDHDNLSAGKASTSCRVMPATRR